MTSTHASAPTWTRVRAGLYRSTAGHAVERLTADTAPGLSGMWRLTHDGQWWGDWSTLAAARDSVAAVSRRVAALDALPTEDDDRCPHCGEEVSPVGSLTLRADGRAEHGWDCVAEPVKTRNEVERDRAEQLLDEVEARAEQQHADDEADRAVNAPRTTTRDELIARQVASGVTPERAAMVANARDTLQRQLTAAAPTIGRVLDDEPAVDDDPREQPAPLDWSAIAAEVAEVRA